MALSTAKRRIESERPSLTKSIDAAFGFIQGSRRISVDLAEDIFLVLGLIAESLDVSGAVRAAIATSLASFGDAEYLPAREVSDRLLDVRRALDAS